MNIQSLLAPLDGQYNVSIIPPTDPVTGLEERPISDLPTWMHPVFAGQVDRLNQIQTQICDFALGSDANFLVAAPTGAGKTNVALLSLLRLAAAAGAGTSSYDRTKVHALYIAPMKSLVSEQVRELSTRLSPLGLTVAEVSGDTAPPPHEMAATNLLVASPEKWDVITRNSGARALVSAVSLVIIDEIHLAGDPARGPVLDAVVSRMRRAAANAGTHVRFLGLSATMTNYRDVARFIGCPVPEPADPTETDLSAERAVGCFYFPPQYRPVPLTTAYVTLAPGRSDLRTATVATVAALRAAPAPARGPVLVFCHGRRETVELATRIASTLGLPCATDAGESPAVVAGGVGFHHAGLAAASRHEIEDMFRAGRMPVLVSTATLAWGVNLPARFVVVAGATVFAAETGRRERISANDLQQMFGRAGRPQFDRGIGAAALLIAPPADVTALRAALSEEIVSGLASSPTQVRGFINSAIALGDVVGAEEAVELLSMTLLAAASRSPERYGVPFLPEDRVEAEIAAAAAAAAVCPAAVLAGTPASIARTRVWFRELAVGAAETLALGGFVSLAGAARAGDAVWSPTSLGHVAARYYIDLETTRALADALAPELLAEAAAAAVTETVSGNLLLSAAAPPPSPLALTAVPAPLTPHEMIALIGSSAAEFNTINVRKEEIPDLTALLRTSVLPVLGAGKQGRTQGNVAREETPEVGEGAIVPGEEFDIESSDIDIEDEGQSMLPSRAVLGDADARLADTLRPDPASQAAKVALLFQLYISRAGASAGTLRPDLAHVRASGSRVARAAADIAVLGARLQPALVALRLARSLSLRRWDWCDPLGALPPTLLPAGAARTLLDHRHTLRCLLALPPANLPPTAPLAALQAYPRYALAVAAAPVAPALWSVEVELAPEYVMTEWVRAAGVGGALTGTLLISDEAGAAVLAAASVRLPFAHVATSAGDEDEDDEPEAEAVSAVLPGGVPGVGSTRVRLTVPVEQAPLMITAHLMLDNFSAHMDSGEAITALVPPPAPRAPPQTTAVATSTATSTPSDAPAPAELVSYLESSSDESFVDRMPYALLLPPARAPELVPALTLALETELALAPPTALQLVLAPSEAVSVSLTSALACLGATRLPATGDTGDFEDGEGAGTGVVVVGPGAGRRLLAVPSLNVVSVFIYRPEIALEAPLADAGEYEAVASALINRARTDPASLTGDLPPCVRLALFAAPPVDATPALVAWIDAATVISPPATPIDLARTSVALTDAAHSRTRRDRAAAAAARAARAAPVGTPLIVITPSPGAWAGLAAGPGAGGGRPCTADGRTVWATGIALPGGTTRGQQAAKDGVVVLAEGFVKPDNLPGAVTAAANGLISGEVGVIVVDVSEPSLQGVALDALLTAAKTRSMILAVDATLDDSDPSSTTSIGRHLPGLAAAAAGLAGLPPSILRDSAASVQAGGGKVLLYTHRTVLSALARALLDAPAPESALLEYTSGIALMMATGVSCTAEDVANAVGASYLGERLTEAPGFYGVSLPAPAPVLVRRAGAKPGTAAAAAVLSDAALELASQTLSDHVDTLLANLCEGDMPVLELDNGSYVCTEHARLACLAGAPPAAVSECLETLTPDVVDRLQGLDPASAAPRVLRVLAQLPAYTGLGVFADNINVTPLIMAAENVGGTTDDDEAGSRVASALMCGSYLGINNAGGLIGRLTRACVVYALSVLSGIMAVYPNADFIALIVEKWNAGFGVSV